MIYDIIYYTIYFTTYYVIWYMIYCILYWGRRAQGEGAAKAATTFVQIRLNSLKCLYAILYLFIIPYGNMPYARMPICFKPIWSYARIPICPYAHMPICPYAIMQYIITILNGNMPYAV